MNTKIKKAISERVIANRVEKLAKRIRKDAGDAPIFLLGILKGTTCFLADLMRSMTGDVSFGFIDEVRDVSDTEVAAAIEITFMSHMSITGKHVYLLKDVVTSGVIENYLLTQLRQKNPADLKLVALLDRTDLRTVDIAPDYKAFEVKPGSYVGYGLERDGKYGNLTYIGRIQA